MFARIDRFIVLLALMACGPLGACQQSGGGSGNVSADTAGMQPALPRAEEMDTAVIQMSGLLLIVPSRTPGEKTHIVLSSATGHKALLGFGLPAATPRAEDLCFRQYDDVCYVNLRDWSVDEIGTGGTPTTVTSMENRGLINVSSGSGGHPVKLGAVPPRRMVVLASGDPVRACALASWRFTEYGSASMTTDSLANVIDWQITWPRGSPFRLRFRGKGTPIDVELVPGPSRMLNLLLVNIPNGEVGSLPPRSEHVGLGGTDASHFRRFYDDVDKVSDTPDTDLQRQIPHFAGSKHHLCSVYVSTSKAFVEINASYGTYACMPATGTPP